MTLLPNWRAVLRHAHSVRLMILAALLDGIAAGIGQVPPWLLPLPAWIAAGALTMLAGLATGAALIARVVAQKELSQ